MIKRIRLQNFQAHEELELDNLGRVTTIVGDSDRGKSAIIRALVWTITNKPGGNGFIKHGAKTATVTVDVDGQEVVRTKSKSANSYHLQGAELKAFGSGVPDPVAAAFNVGPSSISMQMDPPFWLSLTGSQLAQELNALTGIDVLTKMQTRASKAARDARQACGVYSERLASTESALADLEPLDTIEQSLEELQREQQSIALERQQLDQAESALRLLTQLDSIPKVSDGPAALLAKLTNKFEELTEYEGIIETYQRSKLALERLRADQAELQAQVDSIKECPTCHRAM